MIYVDSEINLKISWVSGWFLRNICYNLDFKKNVLEKFLTFEQISLWDKVPGQMKK